MALAVLPIVGVAEGVHDSLEDRFQNFRVAIYTKSTHKKFQEASSKITTHCRPPSKGVKQTSFCPPPLQPGEINKSPSCIKALTYTIGNESQH